MDSEAQTISRKMVDAALAAAGKRGTKKGLRAAIEAAISAHLSDDMPVLSDENVPPLALLTPEKTLLEDDHMNEVIESLLGPVTESGPRGKEIRLPLKERQRLEKTLKRQKRKIEKKKNGTATEEKRKRTTKKSNELKEKKRKLKNSDVPCDILASACAAALLEDDVDRFAASTVGSLEAEGFCGEAENGATANGTDVPRDILADTCAAVLLEDHAGAAVPTVIHGSTDFLLAPLDGVDCFADGSVFENPFGTVEPLTEEAEGFRGEAENGATANGTDVPGDILAETCASTLLEDPADGVERVAACGVFENPIGNVGSLTDEAEGICVEAENGATVDGTDGIALASLLYSDISDDEEANGQESMPVSDQCGQEAGSVADEAPGDILEHEPVWNGCDNLPHTAQPASGREHFGRETGPGEERSSGPTFYIQFSPNITISPVIAVTFTMP